jgi:glycosyltransferase involved in cell wall biosynthesis
MQMLTESPGSAGCADVAADVAVIMAVYAGDDPAHLAVSLASIAEQTYPAFRLLVHCDGPISTAQDDVLAQSQRRLGTRQMIARSATRGGLPTALNKLIDAALSDPAVAFIARMDADDIAVPKRLESQMRYMAEHPDVDLAGSWCIEFSREGVADFHKRLPLHDADLRRFMILRSPFVHPTVVFRRAVLDAGFRYDPGMPRMQDYELWSRLASGGVTLGNVPEYLLWYRMGDRFYSRRAGMRRAALEVAMRVRYGRRSGLIRALHYPALLAFFLTRVAPAPLRRLAYGTRR